MSGRAFIFFNDTATTEIYTLSLHDALPISPPLVVAVVPLGQVGIDDGATGEPGQLAGPARSEEHTSELQSHHDLVCRLLLEKKKKKKKKKKNKTKKKNKKKKKNQNKKK